MSSKIKEKTFIVHGQSTLNKKAYTIHSITRDRKQQTLDLNSKSIIRIHCVFIERIIKKAGTQIFLRAFSSRRLDIQLIR